MQTYQKKLNKNDLALNHVGDNSVLDDVILNGIYPIAKFPIGTTHIDKNVAWLGKWVRITATTWLHFLPASDVLARLNLKANIGTVQLAADLLSQELAIIF